MFRATRGRISHSISRSEAKKPREEKRARRKTPRKNWKPRRATIPPTTLGGSWFIKSTPRALVARSRWLGAWCSVNFKDIAAASIRPASSSSSGRPTPCGRERTRAFLHRCALLVIFTGGDGDWRNGRQTHTLLGNDAATDAAGNLIITFLFYYASAIAHEISPFSLSLSLSFSFRCRSTPFFFPSSPPILINSLGAVLLREDTSFLSRARRP